MELPPECGASKTCADKHIQGRADTSTQRVTQTGHGHLDLASLSLSFSRYFFWSLSRLSMRFVVCVVAHARVYMSTGSYLPLPVSVSVSVSPRSPSLRRLAQGARARMYVPMHKDDRAGRACAQWEYSYRRKDTDSSCSVVAARQGAEPW